jgi:putative inorganic carbon (hco3(-)) transporter
MSPMRATWRPPWYAWVLVGVAALALTHAFEPRYLKGHWLLLMPLLVLAGLLIARQLWELPPAVTMCAAIVLDVFSGKWHQLGLGGLPLDRLLLFVVVAMFVLRAPGVARTPPLRIRNVHLLMCMTLMYVILSALAAHTLTSEAGILPLVDKIGVDPYLMFLLAPAVFAGEHERNWLLATLVGIGAYLGITAIFESLGPHSLVFPRYIVNVDAELPGHRAGGPFGSSVSEGFSTFACAVAATIAFTKWHSQRTRNFAGIVGVLCVFACFLTLERGVWIAALAGIVVTALLTRQGRRMLVPGMAAGALLIGGALVLSPDLSSKASARVEDQSSVWARQNMTAAGVRMVAVKPLFGFGWSTYPTKSLDYFREASNYPMNGYSILPTCKPKGCTPEILEPLHDTYLSMAVELGVVGALLWLSSLLIGMGMGIFKRGSAALRPWKLGLLAMTICYLAICIFDPYQAPFPDMLLWVWAGVALGTEPASLRAVKRTAPVPSRPTPALSPA